MNKVGLSALPAAFRPALHPPGLPFLGAHDGAEAVAWGARGCWTQRPCQQGLEVSGLQRSHVVLGSRKQQERWTKDVSALILFSEHFVTSWITLPMKKVRFNLISRK